MMIKKGGEISPRKTILVSDDSIGFNNLRIKPSHLPSSLNILWKLTSKDYKTEGTLKMNFIPEIIKEHETVLVEDPLKVKLVEGEIEDYITRPS